LSIGLIVAGRLTVEGRRILLWGSPTVTARRHVIRALYDGTELKKIDKIVLVDTSGVERDSTTSLSYSRNVNELTITCSITASSSYTVSRVRAYAGSDLYFETTPSTQPSVPAGYKVDVELKITASMSGSLDNRPLVNVSAHELIAKVLGGEDYPGSLNVSEVRFWVSGNIASFTPSKNLSSDGLTLTIQGSTSSHPGGTVTRVEVAGTYGVLWMYDNIDRGPLVAGTPLVYFETTSA